MNLKQVQFKTKKDPTYAESFLNIFGAYLIKRRQFFEYMCFLVQHQLAYQQPRRS